MHKKMLPLSQREHHLILCKKELSMPVGGEAGGEAPHSSAAQVKPATTAELTEATRRNRPHQRESSPLREGETSICSNSRRHYIDIYEATAGLLTQIITSPLLTRPKADNGHTKLPHKAADLHSSGYCCRFPRHSLFRCNCKVSNSSPIHKTILHLFPIFLQKKQATSQSILAQQVSDMLRRKSSSDTAESRCR